MVKYIKPICDCGTELIFNVDLIIPSVDFKINKNGQLAKVPIRKTTLKLATHSNWGRLVCPSCDNEYETNMKFDGEDKGKILRDDRIY